MRAAEERLLPPVPGPAGRVREPSVVLAFPDPFAKSRPRPAAVQAPRTKLAIYRKALEDWCARVELAPDLAMDIGSRTWLRGMTTLLGLSACAIAFTPELSAVEGAMAMPLDEQSRDEFRSQSIAPLVLGGASGRHMGATALVRPLKDVPERPTIQMVSTLAAGDSLAHMLERAGLGATDVSRVTALVGQAVPVGALVPGTQFDITLGTRPAPNAPRTLENLGFRARIDLDLAVQRTGGDLALVRHAIAVDETPLRIRGTVGSSLYRSARNAGAPVAAIQAYLRALDKYVSLESDLGARDEFDLIVAYKRSARGEKQVGDLLYAGVERGGKPSLQLVRWGRDGGMFPAGAAGQARSVAIGQPVAGRITSTYGARRHPILGYVRMHAGIDFGARYGSPIYAVADGTVSFAGRHGGHGNYVRLQHGGGLDTGYGHMSRILVSSGSRVRAGQVIGYVGSTGLSTGPHLHFEAYRGGRTINPAGIAVVTRPQIDGHERDAFNTRLKALLGIAPGAALRSIAQEHGKVAEAGREIDKIAG